MGFNGIYDGDSMGFNGIYDGLPSGKRLQFANLKPWPSQKFVDFPIKDGWIFPYFFACLPVYQRVSSNRFT